MLLDAVSFYQIAEHTEPEHSQPKAKIKEAHMLVYGSNMFWMDGKEEQAKQRIAELEEKLAALQARMKECGSWTLKQSTANETVRAHWGRLLRPQH